MPYSVGKIARKNLERLVRSFNSQATKVNKRYASNPNYVNVPLYTVDDILSRVHTYADLRRERAKLNRFFKKNRRDAQELVFDKETGKYVTKWFKRESETLLRRERKKARELEKGLNQSKKYKETQKDTGQQKDIREYLPDYPRNSDKPDSEKSFKGLEDKLADLALPRIAQLYLEEMQNNGYMLYPQGKKTEQIIIEINRTFPYYLETCFYTGDERSTIEYLYIPRGEYTTSNVLRKVNSVYQYWLECAENIAL